MSNVPETLYVDTHETACDGGGGALGHPKVFLYIAEEKGEIDCPYCGRLFIYQDSGRKAAH